MTDAAANGSLRLDAIDRIEEIPGYFRDSIDAASMTSLP
jgi:hypothetical protein